MQVGWSQMLKNTICLLHAYCVKTTTIHQRVGCNTAVQQRYVQQSKHVKKAVNGQVHLSAHVQPTSDTFLDLSLRCSHCFCSHAMMYQSDMGEHKAQCGAQQARPTLHIWLPKQLHARKCLLNQR